MKKYLTGIIIILIFVVGICGYKYFFQEEELSYDFAVAEIGDIIQEVSATGAVVPIKKLDLQFEIQGKIKDVKVKIGDNVNTCQVLARLDDVELKTHVLEAKATQDVAKAKLDKILAGASSEDIKIYETAKENAETALQNAQTSSANVQQNLIDVKSTAEENLQQDYEDALDTLSATYTAADKALIIFNDVQEEYFTTNEHISLNVREKEEIAQNALSEAKDYIDTADIDSALTKLKTAIEEDRKALSFIREAMDEPMYKNSISATDETNINTERTNIDTAITDITTAQQKISFQKIANQTNINTAQTSLDSAESAVMTAKGNLQSAEDKLSQIKAPPRKEDVDLAQAQLRQGEAALIRAQQQLDKSVLVSPCDGIIIEVEKQEGEMIKSASAEHIISLMCGGKFQIETDIPEVDIGKVDLDDFVEISLDAFPEEFFLGKIIKIDPAETIIQGVVYYNARLAFDELDEKVKSGMTANITIVADSRENVLFIPQRALKEKEGKKIVRIPSADNGYQEKEVETGLRGSNGMIEIISGLNEGDKVITFIKEK
jgi:multidrug efflux pump subunit AcrA (membrane-fusion protein)